jgi:hypothetical protein
MEEFFISLFDIFVCQDAKPRARRCVYICKFNLFGAINRGHLNFFLPVHLQMICCAAVMTISSVQTKAYCEWRSYLFIKHALD